MIRSFLRVRIEISIVFGTELVVIGVRLKSRKVDLGFLGSELGVLII